METINSEELEIRMRKAPQIARVALAAAAAERVNPVYEKHWVADYVPEVKEAIEYAWSCIAGSPIDPIRMQYLTSRVRDEVEYLHEEGIEILASSATVSLRVLETLGEDASASALGVVRAFGSALYVAQMAGDLCKTTNADEAGREEDAWQDAAVAFVDQTGLWTREQLQAVGRHPPEWWVAYEAGDEHLI